MESNFAPLVSASRDTEQVPDVIGRVDRRAHARSVKVMRVARLTDVHAQSESVGLVRDVSSGGMMIEALVPPEVGQSVSIALLDDRELTGEIIWRDGKTVGVKFTSEMSVADILAKPAIPKDGWSTRLPRFKTCKPVIVHYENKTFEAILADISQRGAKILSEAQSRIDSNIVVRLNAECSVAATVKWRKASNIGVEFHRPLPMAELAKWIAAD